MGSVQFQIVPCSSLYFSRSISPFQCSLCYLQGFNLLHLPLPKQFLLFILAFSVCWSLQCLISILTQEGEGGHLFRLTCSVVLQGGRNPADKHHWHVWGVLAVPGPHWVCSCSRRVGFPGLHHSGSRLLCRGPVQSGPQAACPSQVPATQCRFSGPPQGADSSGHVCCARPRSEQLRRPGACRVHCTRWAVCLITSLVQAARFPRVHHNSTVLGVPCVSSGELIFGCNPPGRCQPSRIPGSLG